MDCLQGGLQGDYREYENWDRFEAWLRREGTDLDSFPFRFARVPGSGRGSVVPWAKAAIPEGTRFGRIPQEWVLSEAAARDSDAGRLVLELLPDVPPQVGYTLAGCRLQTGRRFSHTHTRRTSSSCS